MNARNRKIMNVGDRLMAARFLGVAASAALLAGCVSEPIASTRVDPASPIAPEVAKLASADKDFPSFNEIPSKPTDLRPPRIYGERAKELEVARNQLDAATAPNTWVLDQTGAFESRARVDAGPDLGAPTNTDTEAFANTIRKRATPPPPAKR
jgi:hypothetical protein